MAAFHGKQGKVTFNAGAISNVTAWTLNLTADVVDITAMSSVAYTSSTHFKSYLAGFNDWTATITCNLEDTGFADPDPDLGTEFAADTNGMALVLYEGMVNTDQQEGAATRKYTGNGMITDITTATDLNGVATVTYSVQGSGAITVEASDAT